MRVPFSPLLTSAIMQCPRCHKNLQVEDLLRGATNLSESQGKDCCFRCSLFSTCSFSVPCSARSTARGCGEGTSSSPASEIAAQVLSQLFGQRSFFFLSSCPSVPHGLVSPAGHGLVVSAREVHSGSSQDELVSRLEGLLEQQTHQMMSFTKGETHQIVSFTKRETRTIRDMLKGQQGESSGSPSTSGGGGGGGGDTAAGF